MSQDSSIKAFEDANEAKRIRNLNPIRCLNNFSKMIELHAGEQTKEISMINNHLSELEKVNVMNKYPIK